jgi:hypothetical protein
MAHFMGVGGAAKLISNAEDNPQASAARLFPNAAAANRSIFYERSGQARSVSEVYSVLTARYAGAANSQATRTAMASVGGDVIQPGIAVASAAPAAPVIDNAAYLSTFPDVHAAAPVTMASASTAGNAAPSSDPIFRSLFQAPGERAQPISPTVRELWGNSSSLTSVASADPAPAAGPASTRTPDVRAPQPLDLFSDRNGTFS